jgi:DNA-binding XRE family transcriptional regulator
MLIKYNKEIDTLYVHFKTGTSNIHIPTKNEDVYKFVLKANRNEIVGYEIERASENMNLVLNNLRLNSKQRLAVILCMTREKHKKTQKQFAELLKISEGSYKNLEKAEHNITFDTIDEIFSAFSEEESLRSVFMAG